MDYSSLFQVGGFAMTAGGVVVSLAKDVYAVEKCDSDSDCVCYQFVYRQPEAEKFRKHLYNISCFIFFFALMIAADAISHYLLQPHLKEDSLAAFEKIIQISSRLAALLVFIIVGYVVWINTRLRHDNHAAPG